MCLTIPHSKQADNIRNTHYYSNKEQYEALMTLAKTAKKDIVVYKCLIHRKGTKYKSPYKNYTYQIGKEYYQTGEKFTFSKGWYRIEVNRGLHAYTTLKVARSTGYDVCKFIIPAGSQYFINKQEKEIVCDHYIFDSVIKQDHVNNK